MLAVSHYGEGHVKVLRLLLDALSPERREEAANAPDVNGLTPLFFAQTRSSHPDCLKELISARTRIYTYKTQLRVIVFQIKTRLLSIS